MRHSNGSALCVWGLCQHVIPESRFHLIHLRTDSSPPFLARRTMATSDDLIDFNVIESQKENIQALPSGRSAKALAQIYSPPPLGANPSPAATEDANSGRRAEFEKELHNIDEADDPLDVYDRYVKWTLDTYPSAQATPLSQLLPLLERATKAFQSSSHYKNDPRYLKLWLHYIRLFSDAPREAFVFLARHSIGESLALYYEEFAAWLENAGRWNQAEEVYKMGLEREARPAERLLRKFGEFERRNQAQPHDATEPTSPALPTVRPALAAKIDPFAISSPSTARGPAEPINCHSEVEELQDDHFLGQRRVLPTELWNWTERLGQHWIIGRSQKRERGRSKTMGGREATEWQDQWWHAEDDGVQGRGKQQSPTTSQKPHIYECRTKFSFFHVCSHYPIEHRYHRRCPGISRVRPLPPVVLMISSVF